MFSGIRVLGPPLKWNLGPGSAYNFALVEARTVQHIYRTVHKQYLQSNHNNS